MSDRPRFVYVTYIRTTPETLWHALTDPDVTRQYWGGVWQDCTWAAGSPWRMILPDGRLADEGEVVEIDPPRRLVLRWRNVFMPELQAEGVSRMTYLIEPDDGMVKFTVIHEMPDLATGAPSKFIDAVSGGWPAILSSLKSMLETGTALEAPRSWREKGKPS